MPFDWKSPLGYLIVFTTIYFLLMHICFLIGVYLSLEIGFFLLAIEMSKDIEHDIDTINKTATLENNAAEVSKRMRDSIQFHLNAKQLSRNPMYKYSILIFSAEVSHSVDQYTNDVFPFVLG